MSVNKVILVGNVGKDPEVRYLDNGTPVARFPLATSENYKNKSGERVSNTEWHNLVLWRGLAEISEKYVKKGTQLYIEGKIQTRSWDDRDGNKRYTTEIVVDNMQMLGKKGETSGGDQTPFPTEENSYGESAGANTGTDFSSDDTDDLPF